MCAASGSEILLLVQEHHESFVLAPYPQVGGCHDFHASLWEDCQEVPAAKALKRNPEKSCLDMLRALLTASSVSIMTDTCCPATPFICKPLQRSADPEVLLHGAHS